MKIAIKSENFKVPFEKTNKKKKKIQPF